MNIVSTHTGKRVQLPRLSTDISVQVLFAEPSEDSTQPRRQFTMQQVSEANGQCVLPETTPVSLC